MIQQGPETGLFGINKGQAQVLDMDVAGPIIEGQRRQAAMKAARDKKGEEDIEKGVSGVETASKAIFARDREHFDELQKDLKDYVIKNHDKLSSHDPKAYMEFQDKLGRIGREAELSHNLREQTEQIDKEKTLDSLRPEAKDYYNKLKFEKPDYNDWQNAYQLDESKMKKDFDLSKYIKEEVLPFAKPESRTTKYVSPTGEESSSKAKEFTSEHAEDLLAKTAGAHPLAHEQALYNISKLPDSEKQKYAVSTPDGPSYDVNKYLKDKYSSMLTAGAEHEKEYKASQKDKSYTFNKGDGTWESNKFRWALDQRKTNGLPAKTVNVLGIPVEVPELKGENVKEIKFAGVSEGENKPIFIDTPEGDKKNVIPIGFRSTNGKDWQFVGVPMGEDGKPILESELDASGKKIPNSTPIAKPIVIPAQYAKGKVNAEYGFNLDKAIKEANLGITEGQGGATTKKTSSSSSSKGTPKKGDEMKVQGGTAVFNGTKWVMK
jgi:hypothetical protein